MLDVRYQIVFWCFIKDDVNISQELQKYITITLRSYRLPSKVDIYSYKITLFGVPYKNYLRHEFDQFIKKESERFRWISSLIW